MKETLAFQIVALYRDFLTYTTNELKKLGLNFGQIPLILYVGKHPDCMQADLTKALNLDWGYSQRSIAKLVDTGFMTKAYKEKKSCNCLHLTENGKQAFDVCHSVFNAWDKIKLQDFSEEEKANILTLLKQIHAQDNIFVKEINKMKYAIVFSSETGNTKLLADTVQAALPKEDCIYFGKTDSAALKADRIYVGFWTNQDTCDENTAAFLKTTSNQEIFLFGSAGYGGDPAYFEKIIKQSSENMPNKEHLIGSFMCQGKMSMSVRERYEKMLNSPEKPSNIEDLIENFDRALSHPDESDFEALKKAVQA